MFEGLEECLLGRWAKLIEQKPDLSEGSVLESERFDEGSEDILRIGINEADCLKRQLARKSKPEGAALPPLLRP